jgi:hypothetical protein
MKTCWLIILEVSNLLWRDQRFVLDVWIKRRALFLMLQEIGDTLRICSKEGTLFEFLGSNIRADALIHSASKSIPNADVL